MREEGYEYAENCAWCGSRDISFWSSNEGPLCPRCSEAYAADKAERKAARNRAVSESTIDTALRIAEKHGIGGRND